MIRILADNGFKGSCSCRATDHIQISIAAHSFANQAIRKPLCAAGIVKVKYAANLGAAVVRTTPTTKHYPANRTASLPL